MQAYFEPEQAFFISMPQPVFEISIAHKKKTRKVIVKVCLIYLTYFYLHIVSMLVFKVFVKFTVKNERKSKPYC